MHSERRAAAIHPPRRHPLRHVAVAALTLIAPVLIAGCGTERERPSPTGPGASTNLSVQLLSPRSGTTLPSGQPVTVTVLARDLAREGLTGAGFVVRRFAPGFPTLDSVAVSFDARSDTTHDFTYVVPQDLATNTQLDFYGIAYGSDGRTRLSDSSPVIIIRCPGPGCR